jgi:hypothetical protein
MMFPDLAVNGNAAGFSGSARTTSKIDFLR